jgi:hypothetical protein
MCLPEWDGTSLLKKRIKAKAYLDENKNRCMMLQTERGLLVREYLSSAR